MAPCAASRKREPKTVPASAIRTGSVDASAWALTDDKAGATAPLAARLSFPAPARQPKNSLPTARPDRIGSLVHQDRDQTEAPHHGAAGRGHHALEFGPGDERRPTRTKRGPNREPKRPNKKRSERRRRILFPTRARRAPDRCCDRERRVADARADKAQRSRGRRVDGVQAADNR